MGALLHDDGSRLWSVELNGRRSLVWGHPPAFVSQLAASPDGERVAMSIGLEPRDASQPSFLLYILEGDGSVQLADATRDFRSIDSPVFLRPPSSRGAARERLYWIRTGESVDPFGRLDSQVMVLTDEGAREVRVPLRFTEAVFDIHGFPGAATATLDPVPAERRADPSGGPSQRRPSKRRDARVAHALGEQRVPREHGRPERRRLGVAGSSTSSPWRSGSTEAATSSGCSASGARRSARTWSMRAGISTGGIRSSRGGSCRPGPTGSWCSARTRRGARIPTRPTA